MRRFIVLLASMPWLAGCVTVNRYSLFDTADGGFAVGDADVTGAVLLIAAVSGAIGGVVVWLGSRFCRRSASSGRV